MNLEKPVFEFYDHFRNRICRSYFKNRCKRNDQFRINSWRISNGSLFLYVYANRNRA